MLRINLLPSYVALRRANKRCTAGMIVLFLVCLAGVLAVQFLYFVPKAGNETAMATAAQAAYTEITSLGSQAS